MSYHHTYLSCCTSILWIPTFSVTPTIYYVCWQKRKNKNQELFHMNPCRGMCIGGSIVWGGDGGCCTSNGVNDTIVDGCVGVGDETPCLGYIVWSVGVGDETPCPVLPILAIKAKKIMSYHHPYLSCCTSVLQIPTLSLTPTIYYDS